VRLLWSGRSAFSRPKPGRISISTRMLMRRYGRPTVPAAVFAGPGPRSRYSCGSTGSRSSSMPRSRSRCQSDAEGRAAGAATQQRRICAPREEGGRVNPVRRAEHRSRGRPPSHRLLHHRGRWSAVSSASPRLRARGIGASRGRADEQRSG
jgi:hypothetical protein